MSKKIALVKMPDKALQKTRQEKFARSEKPFMMVRGETMSEEDMHFERALERRGRSPIDVLKESSRIQPPLGKGAMVNLETALSFLSAFDEIVPSGSINPALASIKVWFNPEEDCKLFMEGGSHCVWAIAAIDADPKTEKIFTTLVPVRRARNVLRATSQAQRSVMVAVDEDGVCLGSHSIPFGGKIADFPVQPVMLEPIARAVMPSFYYRDVASRVVPARGLNRLEGLGSDKILLDFEFCDVDGASSVVCVAVAMDGDRIHMFQMPRMVIDPEATRMPPAVHVDASFFRYLTMVASGDWTAVELGDEQVIVKGKDFLVIAKAVAEKKHSPTRIGEWRKINVSHEGSWLVESEGLRAMLGMMPGKSIRMKFDCMYDSISVSGVDNEGTRCKRSMSAQRRGGASYVDVEVNKKYMLEAIDGCSTNLVRLSFDHDMEEQPSAPIVVRGEDELFKAIIMPISGDTDA